MVRAPFVDENGLKKGAWSVEEDNRLKAYIQKYGHWNWRELPKFAGLARCGKSCRLRWMNYLRPNVKHGSYTKEEEDLIIKLHQQLGNRWSKIAKNLPGRTDNEIKNYWHTNLRRRFQQPIRINKKKQMPNLTRKSQSNASQTHNNYDYDAISQLNTNANAKTNLHILESCPISPQRTNSITVACSLNSKTLSTSSDDMHINFDLQPHNSTNEYLSPISGLEALTCGSVVEQTFGDGGSTNENINSVWDPFGEEILDHSLTELCDLEAYQLYNDDANFNFINEELVSFPTLSSYWEMIDFSDLPHLTGRPGSYLTYEYIMS